MKSVRTYEKHEPEIESHEGEGTGLELNFDDVLAEVLAIVEPPEPYEELHGGWGTGLELDPNDVMAEVEEILKAGELIEAIDAYLESYWAGTPETTDGVENGVAEAAKS